MQFDEALKQLTEALAATLEMEEEFGARQQFTIIVNTLKDFESVLREANDILANSTPSQKQNAEGNAAP